MQLHTYRLLSCSCSLHAWLRAARVQAMATGYELAVISKYIHEGFEPEILIGYAPW